MVEYRVEIAMIVDAPGRQLIWERAAWNEVAPTQLHRIHAELPGCLAHQPLDDVAHIRTPGASVRGDRRRRREPEAEPAVERRNPVDAGEARRRVARAARCAEGGQVGTHVAQEM